MTVMHIVILKNNLHVSPIGYLLSSYFSDAMLTTAHKSKGLEFETVQLTEDFFQDLVDAAGGLLCI